MALLFERERRADGPDDERVGRAPTAQAHRALCRVDVDVHLGGPERQPEERRRVSALGQQVGVGAGDCRGEDVGVHPTPVHRDVQVTACGKAVGERRDETANHRVVQRDQGPR